MHFSNNLLSKMLPTLTFVSSSCDFSYFTGAAASVLNSPVEAESDPYLPQLSIIGFRTRFVLKANSLKFIAYFLFWFSRWKKGEVAGDGNNSGVNLVAFPRFPLIFAGSIPLREPLFIFNYNKIYFNFKFQTDLDEYKSYSAFWYI